MSDILLRPIIAMQVAVHQLREREDGQTTTEYAILLGFLAIAIIIALFFLRTCCAASSRAQRAASRGRRTARADTGTSIERPAKRAVRRSHVGPRRVTPWRSVLEPIG